MNTLALEFIVTFTYFTYTHYNHITVKLLITIVLLSLLNLNTFGQKEGLKYASFDILFSGIIGGFGSGIHKHEKQTFGEAFINGFWKGCLGGSVNYGSKMMLTVQAKQKNLDWKLCWGSKLINSASNTILYNATINESHLLKNYSLNIGFIRLSTNNKVQVDIISLICAGYTLTNSKIDVKRSLTVGTPIYTKQFPVMYIYNKETGQYIENTRGQMLAQNIIIKDNSKPDIIVHEIIHTYQRNQLITMNKLIKSFDKYENYKGIHNDCSIFDASYFVMNKTIGYSHNFYERQAVFFMNLRE